MRSVRTTFRHAVDIGLRTYLLGIYRYMGLGLAVTAAVAYGLSGIPARSMGFFPLLAILGTFGISLYFRSAIYTMPVSRAQMLFWLFSVLMGVGLTSIFGTYHAETIASAFFITACTFGVMTVYGQNTKRDLTSMGSFMMMGLWGIIIAGFVNIFLKNSMLGFITSLLGVGIFTGLIAYQTQSLRQLYYALPDNAEIRQRMSVLGALNLYLSTINLFLSILQVMNMGNRK